MPVPHSTTVPSARKATLKFTPAAMAITLATEGGVNPNGDVLPQVTTVPSARKARLCKLPAAMATTFVAAGLFVAWP